MRWWVGCFFLVTAAWAKPQSYRLNLDVSFNGQPLSLTELDVKDGESTKLRKSTPQGELAIEVNATEGSIENSEGILMSFKIDLKDKSGQRQILSSPQIIAKENEKAQITVSAGEENPEVISLSVVAKSL